MRHSITFGDKNTWSDWGLIPYKQPVFAPPKPKRKTLDIVGGNGAIDLTEAVTGYPVFSNRTGSFQFLTVKSDKKWLTVYDEILTYLHGRQMNAILEDSPAWYYKGRFSVNEMRCDELHGVITIDYDVEPYRWFVSTTTEDWLWDPFSFVDGVIYPAVFSEIAVTSNSQNRIFTQADYGYAPVCPKFIASAPVTVRFINSDLGIDETKTLSAGENVIAEWIFYGSRCRIYYRTASGTATLSIDFRVGRL